MGSWRKEATIPLVRLTHRRLEMDLAENQFTIMGNSKMKIGSRYLNMIFVWLILDQILTSLNFSFASTNANGLMKSILSLVKSLEMKIPSPLRSLKLLRALANPMVTPPNFAKLLIVVSSSDGMNLLSKKSLQ